MAAAAAAVHPSPPPPPLARRTVAWLAYIHLASAAVDAVICLFPASMWILFWGMATMEIGRLACGEGCAVVTAAYKVITVAARVAVVVVLPFILLLMALMMARAQGVASATATDIEATKEPAPVTWKAVRDTLCDSLAFGILALMAFALLMLIGDVVKGDSPMIGSRRERMGSVIYDVGSLGMDMVNCLVSWPIVTVRVWKAWRKARPAL